jgi:hypothetical protein
MLRNMLSIHGSCRQHAADLPTIFRETGARPSAISVPWMVIQHARPHKPAASQSASNAVATTANAQNRSPMVLMGAPRRPVKDVCDRLRVPLPKQRAVAIPRALSASAISLRVRVPAFCASRMIGMTFAELSASAFTASTVLLRAAWSLGFPRRGVTDTHLPLECPRCAPQEASPRGGARGFHRT